MWRDFADAATTSDWRSPKLAQNATGDALSTLSRGLYHSEPLAFFKPKFSCVQISQVKLAARFIGVGVMNDFYILPDFNRYRSVF